MQKIKTNSQVFFGILVLLNCFIPAVDADSTIESTVVNEGYYVASLNEENEPLQGKALQNDVAAKTISNNKPINADIFGRRSGNFRPFISLTEYYTDNLFKTRDKKESDFVTIISPGFLISVPGLKEITLTETSSISPGGFPSGRFIKRYPGRLQSYLFYAADFELYSRHSSKDFVSHRAEAMLQYNFRGGFSIDIFNQYEKSFEDWGTGEFFTRDEFESNLFNLIASYEASDKTLLRVDYSNYNINFKDEQNSFRDRTDNYLSGYLFYKVRPRLALFGQYEFIDVVYKEDILSNSKEHNVYLGARWNLSEKTSGHFKAGYGKREFDTQEVTGEKGFHFETQIDYRFTPKASLRLSASRKNNETDISRADYIVSDNIRLNYRQKLTSKITSSINLSYTDDKYKGTMTVDGVSEKLNYKYYKAGIAFDYAMRDRIKMRLGYDYSRRNSNFDIYDYTSNTIFLKISLSM